MSAILITGATGNIGFEVIRFLYTLNTSHTIIAGVRNIEKAKTIFKEYPKLNFVHFDFEDFATFETALNGIETVFLLRPPHISDVDTFFKPLIVKIQQKNCKNILFLSVQGAETSKVIPHNKIERLLSESGINYLFLRPSYFMQNLTTTLIHDIQTKREIILPAAHAKFNWIDIQNIGEAGAMLLENFDEYKNHAFEITGLENENFDTVCVLINNEIERKIRFRNVNLFTFFWIKKRERMPVGLIIVMMLLHVLPRFQKEPRISNFYEQLTGKKPTDLQTFIQREKVRFA